MVDASIKQEKASNCYSYWGAAAVASSSSRSNSHRIECTDYRLIIRRIRWIVGLNIFP